MQLQKNRQFSRYGRNNHTLIIWALSVTFALKIANESFLNDTPVHDDASLYHAWWQKIQRFRRYDPDKYSSTFWTFSDLDREHRNQSFHWTLWLLLIYYQPKLGCKRIGSSEDNYGRKSYSDYTVCTVTLATAQPSFSQDTPARNGAPFIPCSVTKGNRVRRYRRTKSGQTNTVIPIYTSPTQPPNPETSLRGV